MIPLSVAIVCKNNQDTLGAVLASVADLVRDSRGEIVAVDSGSTDGTLPLLQSFHARIIHSDWLGHVKTKQKALEAAHSPWVLMLDSDEPLEPDLQRSIRALLDHDDPSIVAARVNRKIFYQGRFLNYAWQPERRLRLVRAGVAAWTGIDPHDKLDLLPTPPGRPQGRVIDLEGTLRHDSFRTFADHLAKQVHYSRLTAQGLHAKGRTTNVWRMAIAPSASLLKLLILKQAWRDGWPGWLAAGTTAVGSLMKHMMLLELSRIGPPGPTPPSAISTVPPPPPPGTSR